MSLRAVSRRRLFPGRHEVFRVLSELQESGRFEEAGLTLQPTIPWHSSTCSQCEMYPSCIPKLCHLHVRGEMKARNSRSLVTVADCPPTRACWSCGQKSDCSTAHQLDLLCNAGCGAVQPIDCDSDVNFYELFGCPIGVIIDNVCLDRAFLSLQKKLHPDKFASRGSKHQEISGQVSAMVNMAYQTLKNPVKRVQYLLKLLGIGDILEEGPSTIPPQPDLLNEVFEVREKLENCKSPDEVHSILELNRTKICEVLEELQDAFTRRDYEMLAYGTIRLQYFSRIQDDASSGMHSFE